MQKTIVSQCPLFDSFRVQQVAGMFDLNLQEKLTHTFEAELPDEADPWQVGLIIGPSGSGKTTLAREVFGANVYEPGKWESDKAVIDGFGTGDIHATVAMLTSVGFSSPPSWVKPYHVLSNGERFRCDLAKALLGFGTDEPRTVVFDEFTSLVDRTVAKIGSAAVAKAIRRINAGTQRLRFVAVTCHYDVAEWLTPDWVLDLATGKLARGSLQRPPIELEIFKGRKADWPRFAPHHYMNPSISNSATPYIATWNGLPVGVVVTTAFFGRQGKGTRDKRRVKQISRIVVLPDYQGIGIGNAMLDAVAEIEEARGFRVVVTSSHPAMQAIVQRSPRWKSTRFCRYGRATRKARATGRAIQASYGRATLSACFLG